MKTPEQIKEYIEQTVISMLTRPLMYADTASAFEIQVLNLIHLNGFINESFDKNDRIISNEWRKFCHKSLGYSGPLTVAAFLQNKNLLDDNWKELILQLKSFIRKKHYFNLNETIDPNDIEALWEAGHINLAEYKGRKNSADPSKGKVIAIGSYCGIDKK